MRTRSFQIRSGTITFASGAVTVQVPRKTRAKSRSALIGIGYMAVDPKDALLVAITSLLVGSRQYVKGDSGGVILGLLAPGAEPAGTSSQVGWTENPYFPCSAQLGEGGRGIPIPGGGFAGGIPVHGGEQITVSLAEIDAGNNPIGQLVFHFVQFDDAPSVADIRSGNITQAQRDLEEWWARFERGIGQVFFHGTTISHANGVTLNTQAQQTLNPPWNGRMRRLEIRGEKTTTTAVAEDDFQNDFAIVSSSTEKANAQDPIPARCIFGHAHMRHSAALVVDIENGDKTLIDYSGPDPGAAMVIRLLGIYEGADPEEPALCGHTAF